MKSHPILRLSFAVLGLTAGLSFTAKAQEQPFMQDYLLDAAFTDGYWETSNPSAEGLDEEALFSALAFIKTQGLEIHSFTIIKNGKLVFDRYGMESSENGQIQRTPAGPEVPTKIGFPRDPILTSSAVGSEIRRR